MKYFVDNNRTKWGNHIVLSRGGKRFYCGVYEIKEKDEKFYVELFIRSKYKLTKSMLELFLKELKKKI